MVHPELRKKVVLLIEKCKEEGISIRVTSDVRDCNEQNTYYYGGTSNAFGSEYQSYHQWRLAFDVCIVSNTLEGCYDKELLMRVGEIGKSLGLEWGGDWKNFVDMPHFQLKDFGDNINYLKKLYGNPAVFADTWTFNEESLRILEEELGVGLEELVKLDSIVLVADIIG